MTHRPSKCETVTKHYLLKCSQTNGISNLLQLKQEKRRDIKAPSDPTKIADCLISDNNKICRFHLVSGGCE